MNLQQLLKDMVDAKASDVYVIAGLPLTYQVGGRQVRLGDQARRHRRPGARHLCRGPSLHGAFRRVAQP